MTARQSFFSAVIKDKVFVDNLVAAVRVMAQSLGMEPLEVTALQSHASCKLKCNVIEVCGRGGEEDCVLILIETFST